MPNAHILSVNKTFQVKFPNSTLFITIELNIIDKSFDFRILVNFTNLKSYEQ